jgi:DNA-binding NarL/FixJ family response regulator
VTKSIRADDLVAAVQQVAAGDAVFSPRLAGFVLDAFAAPQRGDDGPGLDHLTDREREVMRYLARGYAYKEIGLELGISVKTVESHASAVLRKLQLSSRGALTRWAAARHLL